VEVMDITALGEILIDFTPAGVNERGIPLFSQNPGGGPVNMLAMYSKLGGQTAFIGEIGRDHFGDFLRKAVGNAGIDTFGLVRANEVNTTLAFVRLDEKGDRSFSFYRSPGADIMLEPNHVCLGLIGAAENFHFSGVSLTGEPSRQAVYYALDFAVKRGKVISYDPNYRPLLWGSASEAEVRQELVKPLAMTDILKVSEEEMVLMTGESDMQRGAAVLSEAGPAIVLVSLGPKGAFFFCHDGTDLLATYDVPVIDTTGAGDAFLGAALFRLRGKKRSDLMSVTRSELSDIVLFANAAGSLATTKTGGIPAMPSRKDIARLVSGGKRLDCRRQSEDEAMRQRGKSADAVLAGLPLVEARQWSAAQAMPLEIL
jgi:fructokinase